jgi:Fur family zinc uptake transcriptional regulator
MEAVAQELQQAGFTSHHKAIEVHGLCAHCAELRTGQSIAQ